jgi:deoxyribose-phosphate aldolase
MEFAPISDAGRKIAPLIDHTLLKPDASLQDIAKLCREAIFYGFAAVCVNPCMVKTAAAALKGSGVKTCTVAGFPLGASTTVTKAFETSSAVQDNADEIDMVINVSFLKMGNEEYVQNDIRSVTRTARNRTVKVILETHLLTDEQKETACRLAMESGAHFVKTTTGFTGGGATVADITLMRRVTGPDFGVKASAGIRTLEDALRMVKAGANRIGTSAAVAIVSANP